MVAWSINIKSLSIIKMWKEQKVSVIFPTYNEKDSIYNAIQDFFSCRYVDEIVVVNNNAVEGTEKEVNKTKARQVFEKKQGYGWAIRRGLREAKGDILIISEPDGTFVGNDVIKLLAYSDDFDVVLGTRTQTAMIWKGANMGWFLHWGNFFIAKMIQFLFDTTELSDVGCTMRLIKRKALEKISPHFTTGGSYFELEIAVLSVINKIKFIEIPLNYKKRIGKSSITGSKLKAFKLGAQMIAYVLGTRLKTWVGYHIKVKKAVKILS